MTCSECEPLIDLFADGELESVQQATVSSHVASCSGCAAKLASIRELGESVRAVPVSGPPSDLWDKIADKLTAPPHIAGKIKPSRRVPFLRIASVAALVLIAIYTGWLAYGPDRPVQHAAVPEVNLGPMLENGIPVYFTGIADFQFTATPIDKVRQQVDFRVVDQPKLAEGFAVQQSKLGCCGMHSIVQTEYQRNDEKCVMFQYPRNFPVTYGAAPTEEMKVGEKNVTFVQGKSCWAASWNVNGTGVTIVGPRDRGELLRMVAKFEQSLGGKTE